MGKYAILSDKKLQSELAKAKKTVDALTTEVLFRERRAYKDIHKKYVGKWLHLDRLHGYANDMYVHLDSYKPQPTSGLLHFNCTEFILDVDDDTNYSMRLRIETGADLGLSRDQLKNGDLVVPEEEVMAEIDRVANTVTAALHRVRTA